MKSIIGCLFMPFVLVYEILADVADMGRTVYENYLEGR